MNRLIRMIRALGSAVRWVENEWQQYQHVFMVLALLALFVFVAFFRKIVILVDTGQAGVRFWRFYGTEVDRVYGEGIYLIPPWDRMTIYNTQLQEVEHSVAVLTTNGLEIKLTVSIRYRPEYAMLGVIHQQIGPDYVKKVILPEVDEVLRTFVGRYTDEEVYTTQRAILERIFVQSIENAALNHVSIERVIIRTIELPPTLRKAIEQKLEHKQNAESYAFILSKELSEARRKKIQAEGDRDYNVTVAPSLTPEVLRWKAIEATRDISRSTNSKVIIMGNSEQNLPVLLGGGP